MEYVMALACRPLTESKSFDLWSNFGLVFFVSFFFYPSCSAFAETGKGKRICVLAIELKFAPFNTFYDMIISYSIPGRIIIIHTPFWIYICSEISAVLTLAQWPRVLSLWHDFSFFIVSILFDSISFWLKYFRSFHTVCRKRLKHEINGIISYRNTPWYMYEYTNEKNMQIDCYLLVTLVQLGNCCCFFSSLSFSFSFSFCCFSSQFCSFQAAIFTHSHIDKFMIAFRLMA